MANDIWTPGTNWNTGTDYTEAKAEQEITDDIHVLSLAVDGDTSASTIKHRHRQGTYATLLTIAPGEAGRFFRVTDLDCVFYDDGTRWQPLPGMAGKNCEVFDEDFILAPSGWVQANSGSAAQAHSAGGESAWGLNTGATINSVATLKTELNWGAFSSRVPAWYEIRIKDSPVASYIQEALYIGLLTEDNTSGIFFDKNSAGAEANWFFRVRDGGTDQIASSIAATTGGGWLVFRFVVESTAVIKSYFGDTLISTFDTGVSGTMPGAVLKHKMSVQNLEATGKGLTCDRVLMLAKRS